MARQSGTTSEAIGLLAEDIPSLSSSARNFVRHHPREARLAVAVALETAAAQREAVQAQREAEVAPEVPQALRPFLVTRSGKDILGVSEAAAKLEVSRTTVYDWVERGTLIAWKSTRRGLHIPGAQILGPAKVVPGLAKIVDIIGEPELAWTFLTQEWPFSDTAAAPLDLLKAGRLDEVLDAAPGFGATFS